MSLYSVKKKRQQGNREEGGCEANTNQDMHDIDVKMLLPGFERMANLFCSTQKTGWNGIRIKHSEGVITPSPPHLPPEELVWQLCCTDALWTELM